MALSFLYRLVRRVVGFLYDEEITHGSIITPITTGQEVLQEHRPCGSGGQVGFGS